MALASWPTCTAREAVAICLVVATTSCSSSYQPQMGPRLSIAMDEGSLTYVRDGQRFKHGFTGGGLVEAVEDDPEAKQAADRYQSRLTSGLVLYLVGTGCLVTGMVVGFDTLRDRESSSTKDAVLAGALVCGVAGLIAGGSLLASGMPYQWDAINIYNDNLERRRAIVLPPAGPPGYVPYSPVPVPLPTPTLTPPPPPPLGGGATPDPGSSDAGAADGP